MRRQQQRLCWWFCAVLMLGILPANVAWGYFFDDRREMSLSGLFYTRGTFALTNDHIGTGKGLYNTGNLVQHRNFLTLEWRHNINRLTRQAPTIGSAFEFLNLDAFDYYLNLREEYDGVWDYGPKTLRRQLDGGVGGNYWDKYYGRQTPKYPGQFARYKNFEYITSINFMEKKVNQLRLFEWYFNITKGPLFIRIGRQNLSWGETDAFRLLDAINPLDNLFGGFLVSLDERRVPLNMLRAQWSFGSIGPIKDLTLEGFVSPDRRTNAWYVLNQGSFWSGYTATAPVAVGREKCGGPVFGADSPGPDHISGNGIPCSVRAQGPHSDLDSSRGGARLIGTISDFTFSIAHYYTWQDRPNSAAMIVAPSAGHLAWDYDAGDGKLFKQVTGKDAFDANGKPINNPWGSNDPSVGAKGVVGGPGNAGVPAKVERDITSIIREKRVQITGASLSFPVNALTGMFVGSDNPLYYLYTTFRSEFAYFRNLGMQRGVHDGIFESPAAQQRFLTLPLARNGVNSGAFFNKEFLPGGAFASEGNCSDASGIRGCRLGHMIGRDAWGYNIGLDHNQWILWLNSSASFAFTAQFFKTHIYSSYHFKPGLAPSLTNDIDTTSTTLRRMAPIGPNRTDPALLKRPGGPGNRTNACLPGPLAPCGYGRTYKPGQGQETFTFGVSTSYMGGNLRPSFNFFYDWQGAYLMQPGIDWTFWDPFRVSLRVNEIQGKYVSGYFGGIGASKTKSSAWIEFQYLLY